MHMFSPSAVLGSDRRSGVEKLIESDRLNQIIDLT